jgi:hypothetical protein
MAIPTSDTLIKALRDAGYLSAGRVNQVAITLTPGEPIYISTVQGVDSSSPDLTEMIRKLASNDKAA